MYDHKLAYQDFIDNVFIDTKETEEQRLTKYGRCEECHEINTDKWDDVTWCLTCTSAHFRKDFDKWTSGNKEIDYFIQNTQIHAWNDQLVLEWYPWENFSNIEEIGKGGYATVFRAKPKVGRIRYLDHKINQWSKTSVYYKKYVALKTMGDSEFLSKDVLNEVTHLLIINNTDHIIDDFLFRQRDYNDGNININILLHLMDSLKMKALVNTSLLSTIVKMEIYVNNYNVDIGKLLGRKRLK